MPSAKPLQGTCCRKIDVVIDGDDDATQLQGKEFNYRYSGKVRGNRIIDEQAHALIS